MSDNYIYIGCGYILNETANPVLSSSTYYISNTSVAGCNLRYQNENILAVYKNGNYDPNWTVGTTTPYGNKMASCPQASFDVNAVYSVDYIMLSTMHTSPTTITVSYQTDILSSVADLSEVVENKQNHDSALDNIVDLANYEVFSMNSKYTQFPWYHAYNILYIKVFIPFKVRKNVTPTINVRDFAIFKGTGTNAMDVSNKFTLYLADVTKDYIILTYGTTDSTTISDIKSYGNFGTCSIVADCRGKI